MATDQTKFDKKISRYCFICGFDLHNAAEEGFGFATFGNTCDCCLFQYGVDDTVWGENGLMEYREDWIKKGLRFRGKLHPSPISWTLNDALLQLRNLKLIKLTDYFSEYVILENSNWTSEVDVEKIVKTWNQRRA